MSRCRRHLKYAIELEAEPHNKLYGYFETVNFLRDRMSRLLRSEGNLKRQMMFKAFAFTLVKVDQPRLLEARCYDDISESGSKEQRVESSEPEVLLEHTENRERDVANRLEAKVAMERTDKTWKKDLRKKWATKQPSTAEGGGQSKGEG